MALTLSSGPGAGGVESLGSSGGPTIYMFFEHIPFLKSQFLNL